MKKIPIPVGCKHLGQELDVDIAATAEDLPAAEEASRTASLAKLSSAPLVISVFAKEEREYRRARGEYTFRQKRLYGRKLSEGETIYLESESGQRLPAIFFRSEPD